MTAPTRGFGATRPQPRHARSRARRIADRSAGRSESEAEADASEDMPRLGIEVPERGGEALVLPGLEPQLGRELHRGEAERRVGEQYFAGVGRIDDDRPSAGRQNGIVEADRRLARAVVIDAEPGREIHEHELPARDRAIVIRLQVHAELELVAGTERGTQATVLDARQRAMHPAHTYPREQKASRDQAHPRTKADAERGTDTVCRDRVRRQAGHRAWCGLRAAAGRTR